MGANGFIKLDRKILEWEWYSEKKVKAVFIHLLLCASYRDTKYRGKAIERGEYATTIPKLAQVLDCSEQEIKTAVKKLVTSGCISKRSTNIFTVFKVLNYDVYQAVSTDEQHSNNPQITDEQPTSNIPVTDEQLTSNRPTIDKENKNIKNIYSTPPPKRFVRPTVGEIAQYCEERGNGIDAEKFFHHYEAVDWKVGNKPMKNWRSAIITWEKREPECKRETEGKQWKALN